MRRRRILIAEDMREMIALPPGGPGEVGKGPNPERIAKF